MHVTLLGPVRVVEDDREIDLAGARNRALVARLALDAGRPVGAAVLVEDLWGERTPADAANALQSVVSRTRRRLPDGALRSTSAGYVLDADVDAAAFHRLTAAGHWEQALALWTGEALADVREFPFADRRAAALEELRLGALENHLTGRARDPDDSVLAQLADLTREHPYRDGFWSAYLTALAVRGRSSEALTAYQGLRERLADELGADPSPALQRLHEQLLRGEDVVDSASRPASQPPRQRPSRRLPAGLTSFVGREVAVHDLVEALTEHRLVTVLGPGGAGKTRLAIETARAMDALPAARPSEVWLAELAPLTSGDDVVQTVLAALGLLEVSVLERASGAVRHDLRRRLLDGVRDAEGLLVLDNCEHLVDAVAAVVDEMLASAPRLRVLATSREPLRIIGEVAYPLAPLAVPTRAATVGEAAASSAVQLFVERARTVDRTFTLDEATLPAVREICARLDGQPLAIELAAARLRTLTVEQVAARLSDRFRLLTGGSRTALPRHRTLRAVVEWSWDLLDERERDLAERVSVFPAGVTVASAAAVARGAADAGAVGAGELSDIAELLESLADKSLLVPVRGEERYRMLETLREYGTERLVERGICDEVRSAHLDHFLDLAETLGEGMKNGSQMVAVRVIDLERGNLTSALRYAIDRGDRPRAARMTASLAWFWSIRNEHLELDEWAASVVSLPGEADPGAEVACLALAAVGAMILRREDRDGSALLQQILRVWDEHRPTDSFSVVVFSVLEHYGLTGERVVPEPEDLWTRSMVGLLQIVLMENAGELSRASTLVGSTIEGFRACGDAWGLATVLGVRGMSEAADGRFDEALATWGEAMPLLEQLGAEEDVAFARMRVMSLRLVSADEPELAVLRHTLDEQLAAARSAGERSGEALARMGLAQLARRLGDHRTSADHLDVVIRDLSYLVAFGSGQFEAMIRAAYAASLAACGDLATANDQLEAALAVALATQDMPVLAYVAGAAAEVRHRNGDDDGAARLLGAARAVRGREDLGNQDVVALGALLRQRLGDAAFSAAYARAALSREAAVELVARAVTTAAGTS